jgi:hypothetical protein
MSIIGCILIAVIAQRWKAALIAAFIIGLLGSAVFGLLHWYEQYGTAPEVGFIAFYIATGTVAFVAETAAFFAIKLGIRALRARQAGRASNAIAKDSGE